MHCHEHSWGYSVPTVISEAVHKRRAHDIEERIDEPALVVAPQCVVLMWQGKYTVKMGNI
jgi:hypothetical protein